ncbi:hypothetical protein [Tepidimonas aquatica]|uniref:Uncharacterized protein n=1 Tax=Tepidimonas aquatica TaxID=247482 RepID=A0A554WHF2_9BURK|nr:hypothetical protein [Tepidimonas aquatica]TSE23004.1 hypothetical protein Taqua_01931 [Tepidimonas aquatica]
MDLTRRHLLRAGVAAASFAAVALPGLVGCASGEPVVVAQRHLLALPVDSTYRLAPWLDLPRHEVPNAFAGLLLTRWEDQRAWLVGPPPELMVAARALARFLHGAGLRAHGHVPDDLVDAGLLPLETPT